LLNQQKTVKFVYFTPKSINCIDCVHTLLTLQAYMKDVKMLVQGFLYNLTLICVEIMYYMPGFSDNHLYLYLFVYSALPGTTPLFCLAMDHTLRRCLVSVFQRKANSAQVAPVPPIMMTTRPEHVT